MSTPRQGQVEIACEGDIVAVHRVVRATATKVGFGFPDVTRIVAAASELSRNIFRFAGSGVMHWRLWDDATGTGIELVFLDQGPGIADVAKAMEAGFSTSGGRGMGLPGAKLLMDDMEVHTAPGTGTRIVVRKWLRRTDVNLPAGGTR